MKYGLDVSITGPYADAHLPADLAVLAEESGWDGFFVQDGLLNAGAQALDSSVRYCAAHPLPENRSIDDPASRSSE